ncbi:hypothetical protein [uncultured Methylophaga sp.]|uniref:hypothetical protein n=1 Tax=uncultured Methylophaga sp. TaxID=285271 RepID=UPI00262E3C51|nr:hypothetical protein [uncultured Methylophaga sp.]
MSIRFPKMMNPSTGKPFVRGDPWPFDCDHKEYGHGHIHFGKKFDQYLTAVQDSCFRGFAFMSWADEARIQRNRNKNKEGMRLRSISEDLDTRLHRRAAKKYNELAKHRSPNFTFEEFFKALMKAWVGCRDIPGDSGEFGKLCPVLGVPMYLNAGFEERDSSVSIHRINNEHNYSPSNVMLISYRANRLISDASFDEIQSVYQFMLRHQ